MGDLVLCHFSGGFRWNLTPWTKKDAKLIDRKIYPAPILFGQTCTFQKNKLFLLIKTTTTTTTTTTTSTTTICTLKKDKVFLLSWQQ